MNNVKTASENMKSMSDNIKKDVLSCGDSRLDGKKINVFQNQHYFILNILKGFSDQF